jgi:DNA invertase Pin-like site-specific DNA recombinase
LKVVLGLQVVLPPVGVSRAGAVGEDCEQDGDVVFDQRRPMVGPLGARRVPVRVRPELENALTLAREIKHAAPDQPVILAVAEMKRLARNAAKLMTLAATLPATGIQLELLTGPLTGIYDPTGMGSMLFAILAVAAQLDRDYIREDPRRTGCRSRPRQPRRPPRGHRLRSLIYARALRDAGTPIPKIAAKLTIKTGKNAGRHPSVASVYRALAAASVDTAD